MTSAQETLRAEQALADWHLGKTSIRFETGGRGVATVSTGVGDHGGVSYGAYQLSSRQGTLDEYLSGSKFRHEFEGLERNSQEFIAKWKDVASREPDFATEQHQFIKRTHYQPVVSDLAAQGIDLTDRGRAVHDALWSTSVQMRSLGTTVFRRALEPAIASAGSLEALSDRQIIEAVQDYKIDNNERLFRSSPKQWDGLLNRAKDEKAALVELSEAESTLREQGRLPEWRAEAALPPVRSSRSAAAANNQAAFADGMFNLGDRGVGVEALQRQLIQAGYTGKDGQPLKPDGDFGPNTRHAVEELQRAHGLEIDGKAGMRSLSALADELHNGRPAPKLPEPERALGRFEDASRGVDPLFQSLRGHVQEMDRGMGRTPDEASDRVAAALCAECRANGLSRVDGVVLGQKGDRAQPGEYVFAYSGSSERPSDWVGVKTAEAVQTPVDQSLAKAETLQRQQAMEAPQMAQAPQPSNDAPVRSMG
mgnify:CR=1 FL=1